MNKQSILSHAKRSALLLSSAFFMHSAKAENISPAQVSDSSKPSIVYLGARNGMLSFKVKYDNLTGQRFTIKVRDVNNDLVYAMDFMDKNFEKNFLLPEGVEQAKYTFVVLGKKTESVTAFKIDVATKVQEDVVVSRQ